MGLYEFSGIISSQLHEEDFMTQFIFTNHSGITRKISKLPRAGFVAVWLLSSESLSLFSIDTKVFLQAFALYFVDLCLNLPIISKDIHLRL